MANPLINKGDWMGFEDEPLTGFSWKSGSKRETTGIIFWSDVFLHTSERTGEKLAIFLVDTQGLFDSETIPVDNSRILTLSTLFSSVEILNIKDNIQEDQLEYLQVKFAIFKN
jgi:atlastin